MDEDEFFPCVCCGIGRQTDSGFCQDCERAGCVEDIKAWGI